MGSYRHLGNTCVGAQDREGFLLWDCRGGSISINRKDKMELVAKDQAQQGPLTSTHRWERVRHCSVAQACGSLGSDIIWPGRRWQEWWRFLDLSLGNSGEPSECFKLYLLFTYNTWSMGHRVESHRVLTWESYGILTLKNTLGWNGKASWGSL